MTTLTINPEDIKMTMCFDVTGMELPIAVYCQHNGKKEKYWMNRDNENPYLTLTLVECKDK